MRIDWNRYEVSLHPESPADLLFLDHVAAAGCPERIMGAFRMHAGTGMDRLSLSWHTYLSAAQLREALKVAEARERGQAVT